MTDFIKSILAGISIGIAGIIYTAMGGGFEAAVLFAVGLLAVVIFQFNLYTGKIGYIKSWKEVPWFIIMILGNFIGCLMVGLTAGVDSSTIIAAKLQNPLWLVFFKAVWCGFLMYIAVDSYKNYNTPLGVIFCVPAFIMAGFEHSIADMLFVSAAQAFSLESFIFILVVLLGNGVGAQFPRFVNFKKGKS